MAPLKVVITAGPTHEPIDSVRYIGNRSSGKMGIALANAAVAAGHEVTLLLGPAQTQGVSGNVQVHRFRTCTDLQGLLTLHAPSCDLLIMAAAVADYRPRPNPGMAGGKFRRTSAMLTLELEPTPDLLAGVGATKRPDQCYVGFALEPRDEMIRQAHSKLERKKVDYVVANPLETMDSPTISAVLISKGGPDQTAPENLSKEDFARWLFEQLAMRTG